MIRVLIVDDHEILRQGVQALLEIEPDFEVVGQARDGHEALTMIAKTSPDVVIMDHSMPVLTGTEATRRALQSNPTLKIISLCAEETRFAISSMLDAGAVGFVPKTVAFEELAQAIRTVVDGKIYINEAAASTYLSGYFQRTGGAGSNLSGLTSREREVLQLIADGKTTKEIARQLQIGVKTAESHRRNLMAKLKIDNIAELTKFALREKIIML